MRVYMIRIVRKAKTAQHRERLAGEGFVHLDQIEIRRP
jgi:hypothetical protein